MKYITITLLNLLFWATLSLAQTPAITASQEQYASNEVEVFFTVADFANIEGFQFSITWNPDHLRFVSRTNVHPSLSFWLNTPESDPGEMRVTWVDFISGAILNIADDEVLFSLNFTVEDPGQFIPLRIVDLPLARIATIDGLSVPLNTTDGLVFPLNLPVEFENFDAKYQENGHSVLVEWATASESNSSHFEVQKSRNAIDFQTISSIDSRGSELEGDHYKYQDLRPYKDQSYYRIKQVDRNGEVQYTEIRTVFVKGETAEFTINPNPTQDYLQVNYLSNDFETTNLTIYNEEGRLVLRRNFSGNDRMEVDLKSLSSGFYVVVLKDLKSGKSFSRKLVKN